MPHGWLSGVCLDLTARLFGASRLGVEAVAGFVRGLRWLPDNAIGAGLLAPKSLRAASRPAIAIDALEPRQFLSSTYFVATNGSDSNPGTIAAPFQTIQHAASIAGPGDTVDIRGGTYRESVKPARSGSAGRRSPSSPTTVKTSSSTAPIP